MKRKRYCLKILKLPLQITDLAISKCTLSCRTLTPTKQVSGGSNRRKNCLLFRYFRIANTQNRVDAINIYGGEQIRELIETLRNVHTPNTEEPNEYDKIIAKLNNHFTPMINKDSGSCKFDKMHKNGGESVAQYHEGQ